MPALEALARERGLWIVEDACEALGAVHADGTPVGARGNLRRVRLLPEQAAHDGGGRSRRSRPSAELKERIDSRAQPGPRARHGLARPRPARLQLPARRPRPARWASRSSSGSTSCWPAARRVAGLYSRGARRTSRALELPCPDDGGDRRSWFVYVVQLPRGVDRDAAVAALRERGVDSKPYLPAIHLMSFYRERFGHREGEFPVCEDVAAPLAGAALLPAAHRRRGRAGGGGAARGHRSLTELRCHAIAKAMGFEPPIPRTGDLRSQSALPGR